jgi:ATP-dependent helicase/nuclease subunit A
MDTIQNTSILASAGTGKTFQLSDRIVKLLASGQVKHDEIAALTFTRAAAAEFIVKVVSKLKEAADNSKKHQELCERLGLSPEKYTQKHFCEMLRQALLASNRITMGTLDSFFAKLVNNFPLEVGLNTGSATTIPDQEAETLRIKALQMVLQDRNSATTLFNNLRDYNNDRDVTNPVESLVEMVKDYHGLFIMAEDEKVWGNAERIFGKTVPRWTGYAKKVDIATNVSVVEGYLNSLPPSKKGGEPPARPKKFTTLLNLSQSRTVSNADVNEVVSYFDTVLNTPEGQPSSYYNRTTKDVSAEIAQAIRNLVLRAVEILLTARLQQTRALFQCLKKYEEVYDTEIRRFGLLGFSDYVTLLTKADPFQREEMEFRLDCSIKHWLLDEFQDTSTLQYEVLKRNIDEIVENAPEDRSVFVVGDLKQSLYEWRSGNRKLLTDLNRKIGGNGRFPERIKVMNDTRRCAPAVLAMVNAVLNKHDDDRNLGQYYSEAAAKAWSENFQEQKADKIKPGEAMWIRLSKPEDADDDESKTQVQAKWIAEHLKRTPGALTVMVDGSQRLAPGITCAVLVSRNKQTTEITEILRQNGIEATDEAKSAVITDNPVTAGLLGIIQTTVHPDNGLARGTAEISPASLHIIQNYGGWNKTCETVAQLFSEHGADGLINELVGLVLQKTNDNFLKKRLAQLRTLAVNYDSKGKRDLAEFAHFIEVSELRDSADRQTVQVITIHRSKGLEYDMVYMPCLNSSDQKIASLRRSDLLFKQVAENNFAPQWLLANPGEEVSQLHPELAEAVLRSQAENAYGNLCRLYVGMTRAKHRLVMISLALKEDRLDFEKHLGKHDFACLLESTLPGQNVEDAAYPGTWPAQKVWAANGNSDAWIGARRDEEEQHEQKLEASAKYTWVAPTFSPIAMVEKLRPSQSHNDKHYAWKPSTEQLSGRALGSLVHKLFEGHTKDTATFLQGLKNSKVSTEERYLYDEAIRMVTECLKSKAVIELLDKPSADTIVWREQKAVLQTNGKMIDAVFDRVHIVPGKEAVVIDYKTNDCSEAHLKELYEGQMKLYRLSVAELCGIPPEKIRCVLIHVRNGTLVEV